MADLNTSIGPVLDGVILLNDVWAPISKKERNYCAEFPTLLGLVLAALPIIIAMALIGFVLGIFDGILSKIRL